MPDSERGLVVDAGIVRQIRAKIRNDAYRMKNWRQIAGALDSLRLGDRRDIVMLDHDVHGVVSLGVCRYEEELGESPRIAIEPRLMIDVRRSDSSYGETMAQWLVTEVIGRLDELRSAASASGIANIAVSVSGEGEMADLLRYMIEETASLDGVPVELDGRIIEVEPYDADGNEREPLYNPSAALSFFNAFGEWDRYAEDNAGGEARRRLDALEGRIVFAPDRAWQDAMAGPDAPPDARIAVSRAAAGFQTGDPLRIVGYLEGVHQPSDVAKFARDARMAPALGAMMFKEARTVGKGNGVSGLFVLDASEKRMAYVHLRRSLVVDWSDPGRLKIGYGMVAMPLARENDKRDAYRIAGPAVAAQMAADILAVAAASPHGAETLFDVNLTQVPGDFDRVAMEERITNMVGTLAKDGRIALRAFMTNDADGHGEGPESHAPGY